MSQALRLLCQKSMKFDWVCVPTFYFIKDESVSIGHLAMLKVLRSLNSRSVKRSVNVHVKTLNNVHSSTHHKCSVNTPLLWRTQLAVTIPDVHSSRLDFQAFYEFEALERRFIVNLRIEIIIGSMEKEFAHQWTLAQILLNKGRAAFLICGLNKGRAALLICFLYPRFHLQRKHSCHDKVRAAVTLQTCILAIVAWIW